LFRCDDLRLLAVDESRGRAGNSALLRKGYIPLNLRQCPPLDDTSCESSLVEAGQPFRNFRHFGEQRIGRELPLMLEEKIVKRPEAVIFTGICGLSPLRAMFGDN
jgi:hypothetical protein